MDESLACCWTHETGDNYGFIIEPPGRDGDEFEVSA